MSAVQNKRGRGDAYWLGEVSCVMAQGRETRLARLCVSYGDQQEERGCGLWPRVKR